MLLKLATTATRAHLYSHCLLRHVWLAGTVARNHLHQFAKRVVLPVHARAPSCCINPFHQFAKRVVLPVHARALPARALPTRARGSTRPRAVA